MLIFLASEISITITFFITYLLLLNHFICFTFYRHAHKVNENPKCFQIDLSVTPANRLHIPILLYLLYPL